MSNSCLNLLLQTMYEVCFETDLDYLVLGQKNGCYDEPDKLVLNIGLTSFSNITCFSDKT